MDHKKSDNLNGYFDFLREMSTSEVCHWAVDDHLLNVTGNKSAMQHGMYIFLIPAS